VILIFFKNVKVKRALMPMCTKSLSVQHFYKAKLNMKSSSFGVGCATIELHALLPLHKDLSDGACRT
jgi:hypothetical protein